MLGRNRLYLSQAFVIWDTQAGTHAQESTGATCPLPIAAGGHS